jgi:hypothetical protein
MRYEIYGRPVVRGVFPHAGADPDETTQQIAEQVATIRAEASWVPLVQTDPETTYVLAIRIVEHVDGSQYL